MNSISIYWWNCGKKTLDFKGSYEEYLKTKGITKRRITSLIQKDIKGFRFRIPLSSAVAKLDVYDSDYRAYDEAIKVFLTLLGDKTVFTNGYGAEYRLNW